MTHRIVLVAVLATVACGAPVRKGSPTAAPPRTAPQTEPTPDRAELPACDATDSMPEIASVECHEDTCAVFPGPMDDPALEGPLCAPADARFTLVGADRPCVIACPERHRGGAFLCHACPSASGDGFALAGRVEAELRPVELTWMRLPGPDVGGRVGCDAPTGVSIHVVSGERTRIEARRGDDPARSVTTDAYVAFVYVLERAGAVDVVARVRVPPHESGRTNRGFGLVVLRM